MTYDKEIEMTKIEILNYVRNMREKVDISRLEKMLDELIKDSKPEPIAPPPVAPKLPSEAKKIKK
jgi:hypothetical protein